MTNYAIQVTSKTAPGETGQHIVGSPEWAEPRLGGEWVSTPDPYNPDPDDVRVYPGPGMKFDPGVPEQFTSDIWSSEKATTMQDDGDGGFYWFYNTQGQLTWHEPTQKIWKNTLPDGSPNTWEPGVANWREHPLDNGVPLWVQPTGQYDAYPLGFIVRAEAGGNRLKSLIPYNATDPSVSPEFWEDLDYVEPEGPQPWVPWPGSGPLYMQGDQVTHEGQTWESQVDNNSWEPGAAGTAALWTVV